MLSYRPSLEVLSFEGMPGWEVWSTNGRSTTGVVRDVVVPCLKELRIKDCPNEEDEYKYGSNFLSSLSSLQKGGGQKRKSVTIKYCKKLLLLKEELGEEGEMNMDKSMPISDHPNVVGFGGNFIHLTSLTDLIIRDCPNMDVPTDGLWPPNLCDFTI
ncbi:hypothetical protein Tco_0915855, partial [Tanacetum coccineum]